MHSKQLYCTAEGFTKESFTTQQTTSMHSRKLYCTAGSFIAQQNVLLHSRKVSPAVKTGEKFLLQQKLEKSSFCGRNQRKVSSVAETENKHHVLPAVSVLPANKAQFAHKPDQIELQLDQSQLPYSEYSGPIPQEAAQPTLTTKRPTTLKWRLHQGVGIKMGRMRYFSLTNMFPSPYQSKTCRCS